MALKTIVKAGNISNLSDARYCAGMGVEMLGFNVQPGDPVAISEVDFKEISGWVSGVRFIGEFHTSDPGVIKEISDRLELDAVEIDSPEISRELSLKGIPVLLKFDLMKIQPEEVRPVMEYCRGTVEYFLLEATLPATAEVQHIISGLAKDFPVLLGGDLPGDQMLQWLNQMPFRGLAVKGSEEIKPGFKDYEALGDILEALEVDDLT